MITVSIIGATGYVGIELLRLLNSHPEVEIKHLISHGNVGKKLKDVYPQFAGSKYDRYDLEEYSDVQLSDSDIVFTALPHGISQDMVADIYKQGVRIIDMSGDYRYRDIDIYQHWYNTEHKYPELAEKAVYGLVELNREEIKSAEIVANPGCYVTASLLGILPLIAKDIIDVNSIIIDAKSGVSGAGKSLKQSLLFNETQDSMKAYNLTTHRHTSEIEYILNQVYKKNNKKNIVKDKSITDFSLVFTPHLIPIKRGILATIYLDPVKKIEENQLTNIFEEYYKQEQFIQLLKTNLPEIKYVVGSNYCHLAVKHDQRTGKIIVISVIDNLIKGSAGQAVQNMNVMFSLKENSGLKTTALYP